MAGMRQKHGLADPLIKQWESPEMREFVPELLLNFELAAKTDEVTPILLSLRRSSTRK